MDETASLPPSRRPGLVRPGPAGLAVLARELGHVLQLPAAERLAVLLADQRRRWQRGDRLATEAYCEALPDATDAETLLKLITSEAQLRRQDGEAVSLAEYLGRFPDHAAAISRQFEVEAALAETAVPTGTRTHETQMTVDSLPPALTVVPGFEILGELGRGGMGVVYKARQLGLNRVVALKMILASRDGSESMRQRFRREAEAVARLDHPHIVPVHAYGEHHGQIYFALGYIGGGSLAQRLAGGRPWPPRRAAELVATLAAAVQHAHEKGIVHRDLKPGNVLLDEQGRPHLTDFGLARGGDVCLTVAGQVLGTPAYMAPEQAAGGGEAGPAADVFGLGAVLYQLLTGRPPYRGADVGSTLRLAEQGRVLPVRQVNPAVPAALARVCDRALLADPACRHASAAALEADLRRYLGRTRRLLLTGAVALLLLGLTALPVVWWMKRQAVAQGPPAPREPLSGEIDVLLTAADRGVIRRSVREPATVPARKGDVVQVEVKLNRPAYIYLIWIDDESSVGIYPWKHAQLSAAPPAQEPLASLCVPDKRQRGLRLTGPPCMETVLLLARETPLPPATPLDRLVGTLPRVPLADNARTEVLYRGLGGEGQVEYENLHTTRGVAETKDIDHPLLDLMERLRDHFEVIRAVRFPKVEAARP